MIKSEWVKLLENEVALLKTKSFEAAQDKMIEFFYDQETERMNCFNTGEDVGYKEEMQNLFSRYQGNYAYEHNVHFTTMALFEEKKV